MEDGMLLILDIVICLATIATWVRPVIRSGCLKAKSVNTESKLSHDANDVTGEIKEHVFGKSVSRRPWL